VALNTGQETVSSDNYNGPAIFTYASDADTAATIEAANYFSDVVYDLAVNDIIFAWGSDAFTARSVSAVDESAGTITTTSIGLNDSIATANIDDSAVTAAKIAAAVAGDGLAGGAGTALSVNVDDSTIETNADTLRVKDAGITNAKLAEDTIQYVEVTVSTAEMKDLVTNQKELVAAPGAGKFIQFLGAQLILDYNSAAYTESGDNMAIRYTDGSGVIVSEAIEATGFVDQTADTITNSIPKKDAIVAATGAVNQALVLDNTGSDYAAGDSPVRVQVVYRVITSGL
jgi:hypothetical protein